MTTYYFERLRGCGRFSAKSDEEAKEQMPKDCILLYKESETTDGLPFIVVHDSKAKEAGHESQR